MSHITRLMTAAAFGAMLVSSALPALAADATPVAPATAATTTPTGQPVGAGIQTGSQSSPHSSTITGSPAGALGTPNSGVTAVPGAAPSGGTLHSGG